METEKETFSVKTKMKQIHFKFINNQSARQFSENFFSSASQRLEFSVCLCLYFADNHDMAGHLLVPPHGLPSPPQLSIGDLKTCCHAAPGSRARGGLHASAWPDKKTVIWTGRRVREKGGKYSIMDCNIYQGSCNDGLNHHLRIDANTKHSPKPHTD